MCTPLFHMQMQLLLDQLASVAPGVVGQLMMKNDARIRIRQIVAIAERATKFYTNQWPYITGSRRQL